MKNNLPKILTLIAMFVMIGSCFVSSYPTKVEAASKKLKVTVPTKTVAVNTTITLKTNVKSKFKSSNKKIATVSAKGVVKAKTAGNVTITVTSKANKAQKKAVKITVKNQLVITAPDGATATLQVGETTKIKTNLTSTYVSSDANIATVSSNGTVTAKSAGTAKITVTSKKYKKLKKTVTITVTKTDEPTTEQRTEPTTEPTTQPSSDDSVKPDDKTTPEAPTAQQPSSETPKSEEPTSEEPTSEEPTSEEPSSEEPITEKTVVGIEASYKGDKVPKGSKIQILGINLYELYSDGSKQKISYTSDTEDYIDLDENPVITQADGREYATYTVKYKELSTSMTIEQVDIGESNLVARLGVEAKSNIKLQKEQLPTSDLIKSAVFINNAAITTNLTDEEISKIYFQYYTEEIESIGYFAIYDYWYEYNGEQLYVLIYELCYF